MRAARIALAVLAGVVVASLSFWHYAAPPGSRLSHGDSRAGGPSVAHDDHEPWYGGQLGMVGDDHIELVRNERGTEVYVSDAWRRPIRPAEAWVVVDGGPRIGLDPEDDELVSETQLHGHEATVTAVLSDGRRLEVSFPLAAE